MPANRPSLTVTLSRFGTGRVSARRKSSRREGITRFAVLVPVQGRLVAGGLRGVSTMSTASLDLKMKSPRGYQGLRETARGIAWPATPAKAVALVSLPRRS